MSMKTVKECDYCEEQVEWTDTREDSIPEHWRVIVVRVYGDDYRTPMGSTELVSGVVTEDHRIEICDKHDDLTIGTIIATALA